MKLVTIGKDCLEFRGAGQLTPGEEYIFPEAVYQALREQERSSGHQIIESVTDYNVEFDRGVEGMLDPKILVYNTGKIGDQLWTSALIREIKRRSPRCSIDVVDTGATDILWQTNSDVRSVRLWPIPFKLLGHYDACLFFDETVANQMDASQKNCYETLFDVAGINVPQNVRPIVRPLFEHEISIYSQMLGPDENGMVLRTRGHFVVGLHSSSHARNLPDERIIEFVSTLAAQTKNKIYLLGYGESKAATVLAQLPNVIIANGALNLLQIAALCRYASCVISPDSMLVHMTASQEAPCVALMSTVPPQYRVSTYPFCVPIYQPRACKFDSCFYKWPDFRYQMGEISETSKCYTPERTTCDIMASVTTPQIFEAINMAIRRKMDRGGYDQSDLPIE